MYFLLVFKRQLFFFWGYFLFLKEVFKKPQKCHIFLKDLLTELEELGLKSLGIVAFIAFFIGGVIAIQTALNVKNPIIPKYLVGFATKRGIILEFAPTFTSIILAGKVGSYITSSIGSMRITEQIDALEIMGVNAASYLVFPKIIATVFFYPFITLMAICLGIFGGYTGGILTGAFHSYDYLVGIKLDFTPYLIEYALIKTVVFAFLIASISAYHGYSVKGGALEVGRASTRSVVWTSVFIIFSNYFLTQLLLA